MEHEPAELHVSVQEQAMEGPAYPQQARCVSASERSPQGAGASPSLCSLFGRARSSVWGNVLCALTQEPPFTPAIDTGRHTVRHTGPFLRSQERDSDIRLFYPSRKSKGFKRPSSRRHSGNFTPKDSTTVSMFQTISMCPSRHVR